MKRVQKILVPVDFSDESANALKYAHSLAQAAEADLIVLHVFDRKEATTLLEPYAALHGWPIRPNGPARVPVDILLREKSLDLYNFIQAALPHPDMARIKRRLRIGRPVKEILAAAKAEEIDLIVLKMRRRSLFPYLAVRGTLLRLIGNAPIPVLLTPPVKDEHGPASPLIICPH